MRSNGSRHERGVTDIELIGLASVLHMTIEELLALPQEKNKDLPQVKMFAVDFLL